MSTISIRPPNSMHQTLKTMAERDGAVQEIQTCDGIAGSRKKKVGQEAFPIEDVTGVWDTFYKGATSYQV